jgi:3-isopropylmalate/(R)-2-methylmalate dehydratase large subunit
MTGKTISEKILSEKSGRDVRCGDIAICQPDCAMGTDGSAPMAIRCFAEMGGTRVFDPGRVLFFLDHYSSSSHPATVTLHDEMREFSLRQGITIRETGDGISHQLMVESGRIRPGTLVVGADSHSVTGGALNAFTTGIGSSDLAAILLCGRIWLKVPETVKVTLAGQPAIGVYPKDIALALTGLVGSDGASYKTLEFCGLAASRMDLEDRLVLSNMAVEMGAKAGIFPCDDKIHAYLRTRTTLPWAPVAADADANYCREVSLDVSQLGPMVARPHQVDNVAPLGEEAGVTIRMVYLGTCTGGRARDFHQALEVLDAGGGRFAPRVQVLAATASREVEAELRRDGTLARLASMGATILPPGCGSCCGTAGPVPADGVNVISTANRNFKARMGNGKASIYLASPAACAAAAVTGYITDPRGLLEKRQC